jgi:ribulose-bisphosphate carboxylase small chain
MMSNHGNRLFTQGQIFSFLPDLTDEQITAQIKYALKNGWAVNVEYTDDPHPRNTYWEMFGMPMFDLKDPAGILMEINNCRKTFPNHYVRVTAFDSTRGWESPRMSFSSTGRRRSPASAWCGRKTDGRSIRYTVHSYAATARRTRKASY